MQPFPVCALCSAPDALVASPPLPRAAPARMAGQGPVQRLPRGYDRCAAGPLPSRNLRGNPEPDVAPRGTAGDRGGTRPVLGAVRAGGADAGDADRADGAEAWAQGRTGMLLDKTPMLSTRRAPRRRSAFFGQDPYNLGRCRHRRAGGRGARRVGWRRHSRGAGDTRRSPRRQSALFGQDPYNLGRCRHRCAGGGGVGGVRLPGAQGTTRHAPRRRSGFFGQDPYNLGRCRHRGAGGRGARRGSVASGLPGAPGPRGTRPGDNRRFSDKIP